MIKFLEYTKAPVGEVYGRAKIQIGSETREVLAVDYDDRIIFYGLALKYRTGKKIWHGEASWWKSNGNINCIHGGLDNRRAGIATLVGFYDNAREQDRSQR